MIRKAVLDEGNVTTSDGFQMPAPTGGWNARDPISRMPPEDAVYLDNWYPDATQVVVRKGSVVTATLPVGDSVQSLLDCAIVGGVSKRFACTDTGVYDITAGGSVPTPVYPLTLGQIEYVNINVGNVNYLWCCNGQDRCSFYRSSDDSWHDLYSLSTPSLTGITSEDVTNVSLFKNRIILCRRDTLGFYYMPLNSVGGAASLFDLGAIFTRGGHLVATGNWTLDSGLGPDDFFVAITSEGEIAIYKGTDPSLADQFAIVGTFYIGRPVGKRCLRRIGGDLTVLTEQGLVPLTNLVNSTTSREKPFLTDKIGPAFTAYYQAGMDFYGWEAIHFPREKSVLINVPTTAAYSYQFVMNALTGAWCRFTGWSARCLMVSEGKLYYAQGNIVYQGWIGTSDSGKAITGAAKQAFTYGPAKRQIKQVRLVRPNFTTNSTINVQLGLDTDFADGLFRGGVVNLLQAASLWDSAIFDLSYWGGGTFSVGKWKTVAHKPGKAWSLRLRCQVKDVTVAWSSTDYIIAAGGIFG